LKARWIVTEKMSSPRFDGSNVEVLERETCYKGFFEMQSLRLKHQLFEGRVGEALTRELFVRGEAAGVLLYDPRTDRVALVEQFRVGAIDDERSPWLEEIVAGVIDPGMTAEQIAIKEVREEAGLAIQHLEPMCSYYVSPGGTSERMHLFCACTDLDGVGGIFGEPSEGEDIRVFTRDATTAYEDIARGSALNNAATIIALQWLQIHKSALQQRWGTV